MTSSLSSHGDSNRQVTQMLMEVNKLRILPISSCTLPKIIKSLAATMFQIQISL